MSHYWTNLPAMSSEMRRPVHARITLLNPAIIREHAYAVGIDQVIATLFFDTGASMAPANTQGIAAIRGDAVKTFLRAHHRQIDPSHFFPCLLPSGVTSMPHDAVFKAAATRCSTSTSCSSTRVRSLGYIVRTWERDTQRGIARPNTRGLSKVVLWALRDARDADRLLRNLSQWVHEFGEALRAPSGIQVHHDHG